MRLIASTLLLLLAPPGALAQTATREAPLVVTTGEGVVQAAPDRAWISVSTESRAGNPADAQRRNAEAMTPVVDRLQRAGVPADGIRTVGYDLQQEWDFVRDRRVSRGYVARNTLEVRVDDIERVGELLELAVESGATSVAGVRFDLKERAKLEREALRIAVEDARARADAVAAAAGRAIEAVLRIDTQPVAGPEPMQRVSIVREAAAVEAPPIAAGQVEIRALVTLTSLLR